MNQEIDANRLYFLEVMYGWVDSLIDAPSGSSDQAWVLDTLKRYVRANEKHAGIKPNVQDLEDIRLITILPYKEAVAVHAALEHAHRTEAHRISYVASLEDASLTPTKLFDRLATAKRIMDVRREHAEEMGG